MHGGAHGALLRSHPERSAIVAVVGVRRLERLTAEDEHILALEHGNVVGHWCKVVIVDGDVDAARLRATVKAQMERVPRLRQRLEFLPRGLGRAVWVDDPGFDLAWHVAPLDTGSPVDERGLRDLVAVRMEQRLDRTRPLWRLEVAPLTEGRTALLWRVHHSMADGFTAMRIGAACIWCAEPPEQQASPRAPDPTPSRGSILLAAALDRADAAGRETRQIVRGLAAMRRWRDGFTKARTVVSSVRRELAPAPIATTFDAPLGRRRAVAWCTLPLDAVHAAAKRVGPGVTLNDAVVALIGSGVSAWTHATATTDHPLRVRIPVSLHSGTAGDAGNRDSFIDVDVPIGGIGVVARLQAINEQTAARKAAHDAERADRVMRAMAALPFGDHLVALSDGPNEFSMCISNVVGPRERVAVEGMRVSALHSVVEVAQHHDLRASVISCADVLSITLCADAERVDPETVMQGIAAAWAELSAHAAARHP